MVERSKSPIKSIDEIRQFPKSTLDLDKPWEYKVSGGCVGMLIKPLLFVSGQGRFLKDLKAIEKAELKELLAIAEDNERLMKLNELNQLDLRIRATNLINRFSYTKIYSFKK